jgi:putative SOS response-associated peptidase YedK
MCGKFTQMMSWTTLVTLSDFLGAPQGAIATVTPMRLASVITVDDDGVRRSLRMRWGMVAHHAADPLHGTKHIHARAETIEKLPTFRDAFARRRGLVVVSTFNEGKDITPTKTEQHTISPRDAKPLAIAVIWERWTHRNDGELLTFAMVTVPANALIGTITDRMPAVIGAGDWEKWLGETPATVDELKTLLKPVEGDWEMHAQAKPGKSSPPPQPDLF